jgi:hypothetical protein
MLGQKVNPHTGKKEYALLSISKPGKVLEWYGTRKPSAATVQHSEKRIQYYKHR